MEHREGISPHILGRSCLEVTHFAAQPELEHSRLPGALAEHAFQENDSHADDDVRPFSLDEGLEFSGASDDGFSAVVPRLEQRPSAARAVSSVRTSFVTVFRNSFLDVLADIGPDQDPSDGCDGVDDEPGVGTEATGESLQGRVPAKGSCTEVSRKTKRGRKRPRVPK